MLLYISLVSCTSTVLSQYALDEYTCTYLEEWGDAPFFVFFILRNAVCLCTLVLQFRVLAQYCINVNVSSVSSHLVLLGVCCSVCVAGMCVERYNTAPQQTSTLPREARLVARLFVPTALRCYAATCLLHVAAQHQ